MRRLTVVVVGVMFAVGLCGMAVAGSLDSPGAPSGGSGMYTLLDIYNYLNSGAVAPTPGPFGPPAFGPTVGTMKTLKEIYEDHKAMLDQCPATAANVESGVKFFCTQSGSWGVQTGTYVPPTTTPTTTPTPTITPTPWTLNSATCNATTGWHWYNSACWSQPIMTNVSWNKGVDSDTSKTGTYTCNTAGTLKIRMEAAVAGRWSEIVTVVNATTITTGHDGVSGKGYISALSIADCVDGSKYWSAETIGGIDWASRDTVLATWAAASGSALPEPGAYNSACSTAGGSFYENTSSPLSPGINQCWTAACGAANGGYWSTDARALGYGYCSAQDNAYTSYTGGGLSFRVVARP
ncbi:MAG: hypothetical protein NTZ78_12695 [Candidatus Aureabacteria bacterium]|nr:hypothetical protein [Candidatus Auribacterota bacterium]